jgi:hypothetical protein
VRELLGDRAQHRVRACPGEPSGAVDVSQCVTSVIARGRIVTASNARSLAAGVRSSSAPPSTKSHTSPANRSHARSRMSRTLTGAGGRAAGGADRVGVAGGDRSSPNSIDKSL